MYIVSISTPGNKRKEGAWILFNPYYLGTHLNKYIGQSFAVGWSSGLCKVVASLSSKVMKRERARSQKKSIPSLAITAFAQRKSREGNFCRFITTTTRRE